MNRMAANPAKFQINLKK